MGRKLMGAVVVVAMLVSVGLATAVMAEEAAPVAPAATTEAVAVNVGNTVCPVTGKVLDEPGLYTVEYNGKVYNLCSPDCASAFLNDAETLAAKADAEVAAVKAEAAAAVTEEAAPMGAESSEKTCE